MQLGTAHLQLYQVRPGQMIAHKLISPCLVYPVLRGWEILSYQLSAANPRHLNHSLFLHCCRQDGVINMLTSGDAGNAVVGITQYASVDITQCFMDITHFMYAFIAAMIFEHYHEWVLLWW